jgi:hypothetical protein
LKIEEREDQELQHEWMGYVAEREAEDHLSAWWLVLVVFGVAAIVELGGIFGGVW